MSRRLCLRTGVAALATAAAFAAVTSSASAGPLVASAPSCEDQPLAKTFAPWLDPADYTPLPGGDFEGSVSSWSFAGGAGLAAGNSPYAVGGDDDASSLVLPAGGSATSASICVGLTHPTVRFFARRRSSGLLASLSTLNVDVLFELADGSVATAAVGSVLSDGSWQPTLPMPVVANLLPLLPGEHTPVAFRCPAHGGDWSVDDVWVDPYSRK